MRIRTFATRRVSALLAVAFLFAWAHVPIGHTAPDADVPVRVMTYNIHAGDRSLDNIAAVIRRASPDLAALQEVDVHWGERSAFADQPRILGQQLGMEFLFASIYHLPGRSAASDAREYGGALLSRYPVLVFRNDTLTRLSTQDPSPVPAPAPGLLEAHINVGGTTVRVFNTHLDYRADPGVRRQQVSEMLNYISNSSAPTLVFGDLNATPDAPELAPLFERLHDSWPSSTGSGFTYPAEHPAKRIDYVLSSSHFRTTAAVVPVTDASDHRPVVVDLVLHK